MISNNRLPSARTEGLIVRDMADEVLVYDMASDRATALNPIAAQVWRACDGESDVAAIVAQTGQQAEVVWAALEMLGKEGLLDAAVLPPEAMQINRGRRSALTKFGTAALVAAPVVIGITVPTPAQAASCKATNESCVVNSDCCSGFCFNGSCAGPV